MIQSVLINDKWLKEFSIIPLNFNTKEVQNYIKLSEVVWLEPIIGNAFYEELLYQVKENKLSPENSTLLVEAIYPYLGFCIAYEALPTTWAKITEVGIVKSHSDTSESITLKDLTLLQQHIRAQIEARKDYLIKYLRTHCDSFPLYHPTGCGCDGCSTGGKLHAPKPLWTVYGTRKRCTTLL